MQAQRVYKKLNYSLMIWSGHKSNPDVEKGAIIQPNIERLRNLSGEKVRV